MQSRDEQIPAFFVYQDHVSLIKLPAYSIYTFLRLELDRFCQEINLPQTLVIPPEIADNPAYRHDLLEKYISAYYYYPIRPDIKPFAYSKLEPQDTDFETGAYTLVLHEPFHKYFIFGNREVYV